MSVEQQISCGANVDEKNEPKNIARGAKMTNMMYEPHILPRYTRQKDLQLSDT